MSDLELNETFLLINIPLIFGILVMLLSWSLGNKALQRLSKLELSSYWKLMLSLNAVFILGYLGCWWSAWHGMERTLHYLMVGILFLGPCCLCVFAYSAKKTVDVFEEEINLRRKLREDLQYANEITNSALQKRTSSLELDRQRLKFINEVTKEVSLCLNVQAAAQVFLEKTVLYMTPSGSGSVLLYNNDNRTLEFLAHFGLNPEYVKTFEIEVDKHRLYTFDVFVQQQCQLFDKETLAPFQNDLTEKLHFGRKYLQQLAAPLVSRGKSIGLVTLSHYDPTFHFSEEQRALLSDLTHNLAHHLENFTMISLRQENLAKERRYSKPPLAEKKSIS
ncbi:GAF domain-containing protein [Deltaproteobacteria bacterium TL4]